MYAELAYGGMLVGTGSFSVSSILAGLWSVDSNHSTRQSSQIEHRRRVRLKCAVSTAYVVVSEPRAWSPLITPSAIVACLFALLHG